MERKDKKTQIMELYIDKIESIIKCSGKIPSCINIDYWTLDNPVMITKNSENKTLVFIAVSYMMKKNEIPKYIEIIYDDGSIDQINQYTINEEIRKARDSLIFG